MDAARAEHARLGSYDHRRTLSDAQQELLAELATFAEGQDRTITCQWYGRTGTFTDYGGLAKAVVLDLSTEIPTVLYTASIHFPYTSMQNPLCGDKFPREASAWLADWVYAEGGNP